MKCFSKNNKKTKELVKLASFLKVVADETRLKIIYLLQKNNLCVCEIVEFLALPQNLVSHHLKVLREEGIVTFEKNSLRVTYFLDKKKLAQKIDFFNSLMLK